MNFKWKDYLFLITLTFFSLSFFNIIFGLLGLACLVLPFVLLGKNKEKTWCRKYCPRANLFTVLLKGRTKGKKLGPDWLIKGKGKWFVLAYFIVNIFMIIMSTIMVSKGRIEPVEHVRFLIVFQFPWKLPEFLNFGIMADWVVHLAYRIYSMFFTTTVIGLILGWLFLPRTWCKVCPINTLSDLGLNNQNKKEKLRTTVS
jgi:polyferredoxin